MGSFVEARRKKMALRHFDLEYWTDEGWYVGRLKEVPGIFSQGETLEELEDNIRDAYKPMVEDEIESLPVHIKIQTKEIGVKCF
jgi:predicted RNase H-like HicB family nuclease